MAHDDRDPAQQAECIVNPGRRLSSGSAPLTNREAKALDAYLKATEDDRRR